MTAAAPDHVPAWIASSPASIEEDLRHLWETAARHSPVSRALMSNLVIVAGGAPSIEDVEHQARHMLPGVARRHPARVVLLNHRCASDAREPQHVRVGLLIFGPSENRYGIEMISVAVACLDESLPSILRAITRGDIPTTLWLIGDLSVAAPAVPLVEMSRQMVYDSRHWTDLPRGYQSVAALLETTHPPALVDLAWRRLAPMRRAVATALEPLRFEERPRPEQVTIGAPSGRAAEAWLLWGWFQLKLEWPVPALPTLAPSVNDGLEVRFQGDDWNASVIEPAPSHTDGDGAGAIVARDTAGRTVSVSPTRESVVEALSDELTRLAHDHTLARIVRSLSD